MKTKYKFLIGGLVVFGAIVALSIVGLQEMTVFFYTPQEILAAPDDFQEKTIRIGAMVEKGSIDWDAGKIKLAFRMTEDSQHYIPVVFHGVKPDMFKEGQGVVVQGQLQGDTFYADELLVKHSEDYKLEAGDHKNKQEMYKSLMQ
ncbi:MAG: cytochrome c maturation protein CcmE [SAR324 cluster bacterium]|nr:cytochrome c maturation protein CcmE [SAR324 cluster bacterium]